jgi:hypothetical protein
MLYIGAEIKATRINQIDIISDINVFQNWILNCIAHNRQTGALHSLNENNLCNEINNNC